MPSKKKGSKKLGIFSRKILGEPQTPYFVKFLIKTKLFKNEMLAGYFLIGFSAFAFICSLIIFYAASTGTVIASTNRIIPIEFIRK